MFEPIFKITEGFLPKWSEFVGEWRTKSEPPEYLALSSLARYIAKLVRSNSKEELRSIFEVIERWQVEGDPYVKEAVAIRLLEDLQNTDVVGRGIPQKLEVYLLPESRKWWRSVEESWATGKAINE